MPLDLASVAKLRFRPSGQYNWSIKEKESRAEVPEDCHFIRCTPKESHIKTPYLYLVKVTGDKSQR